MLSDYEREGIGMSVDTVFLTFDDGPDPYKTPRVMRILEDAGVKATFFCIGARIAANPHIVRELARRGHAIENHTYTHPELPTLDHIEVFYEIKGCTDELRGHGLPRPRLFRPPHGSLSDAVYEACAEQRIDLALWTIDPEDWNDPDPVDLFAHVNNWVHDGSVILLHDGAGGDATLEALPYIIRGLEERGFRFGLLRDRIEQDEKERDSAKV